MHRPEAVNKFYERTWHNTNHVESCFVSNAESFATNKIRGVNHLDKYDFIEGEITKTSEIIYKNNSDLNKFKNKKVLVIGAGPTTNHIEWNPDNYDYIFSCNHFFLGEKVKDIKVDLALIGSEVDIESQEFIDYVSKNKTIIGLEDYQPPISKVRRAKLKIDNVFLPLTLRYQGKNGVAPKVVILAALLGARYIDFVGIDGFPKGFEVGAEHEHAFEHNKLINIPHSYEMYTMHYQCFKKYLKELSKDIIYKNLGEGHELNHLGAL